MAQCLQEMPLSERLRLKCCEFAKLQNRLYRHKKLLFTQGFQAAMARGEVVFLDKQLYLPQPQTVYVRPLTADECEAKYGFPADDVMDCSPLYALVQNKYPSLHRRIVEGETKYKQTRAELEHLLAQSDALTSDTCLSPTP